MKKYEIYFEISADGRCLTDCPHIRSASPRFRGVDSVTCKNCLFYEGHKLKGTRGGVVYCTKTPSTKKF